MADEKLDPKIRRDAGAGSGPGKTPDKAEGGDDRSDRPYPNEPGKTPGVAEGEEVFHDPGTSRGPKPHAP